MNRLKGLYLLDERSLNVIYGAEEQREIAELVDIYAPPQTRETIRDNPGLLAEAEVIFSGWGTPVMDEAFMAAAPQLRAVFYGAGSIRYFTTEAFWQRNPVVSSAYEANAIPVAEYTLAVILLSLKHWWRFAALTKTGGGWGDPTRVVPGNFRSTVGLISCGTIARRTLKLLDQFDLHRISYDPGLTEAEATILEVGLVSLEELFQHSDVVSLHTPWLKETEGMITGAHLAAMKPGATFINTARGAIVREPEMIEVLRRRPDLTAVLDVTCPEPPAPDSPLLTLPNVILTPHIAGSLGPECRRLGRYMVEELSRFLAGEPLKWQISKELAAKMA